MSHFRTACYPYILKFPVHLYITWAYAFFFLYFPIQFSMYGLEKHKENDINKIEKPFHFWKAKWNKYSISKFQGWRWSHRDWTRSPLQYLLSPRAHVSMINGQPSPESFRSRVENWNVCNKKNYVSERYQKVIILNRAVLKWCWSCHFNCLCMSYTSKPGMVKQRKGIFGRGLRQHVSPKNSLQR